MLSDRMMCEDIIQNVFVKLFENLNKIRNQQSLQSWLFKSTRNEIFSFYRSKKSHVDKFSVEDTDKIDIYSSVKLEEEFEKKEIQQLILKELDKMAIDQREVFLLKEYGGLSYKEVAEVMSIDEELVKSRLYKVRRKLVEKLSKELKN